MFLSYFDWTEAKEGSVFYILYQYMFTRHDIFDIVKIINSIHLPELRTIEYINSLFVFSLFEHPNGLQK